MRPNFLFLATSFLLLSGVCSAQRVKVIDLHKLVKNKGIEVFKRELSIIEDDSHQGIRLSKDYGEGIAWFKGIEFSEGTIEFDVRGEDVKQHSFVGIAFHGVDSDRFEAVYLRPFNFKSSDEVARSHGIQYISLPEHTWRVLREKSPNQYEQPVNPAPDPNSWVNFRIVIGKSTLTTYINGSKEPSLVVEKLSSIDRGLVGFYVADTSGGDFANLKITIAR